MGRQLVVMAGPDEGRVFPLDSDPLLLGRSRATGTVLIDPHVSRVHCQIQREAGNYVISDFDSAGGTFVNGVRVKRPRTLRTDDRIRIGETELRFLESGEGEGEDSNPSERSSVRDAAASLRGERFGNYKVGSLLARGRTGYVFHGRDTRRNLPVVLKVVDAGFLTNDAAIERFTRTLKQVLPLRHPHLLKVYAAGRTGEHCWIAKEYLEGESLAAIIGRVGSLGNIDWRNVVKVGVYISRCLDYAHGKKLIHGNVTPNNILVGKVPAATNLADLAVSAALGEEPIIVDPRIDVHGLGATLHTMLTGQPPPIKGNVPPPDAAAAPKLLRDIVVKMLSKQPVSAREVLADLESLAKAEKLTY